MPELDGKVIAITGASSGIGAATATLLAARGASVVLGARRTGRLQQLTEQINEGGGRATSRQTDVTRPGDLEKLVAVRTLLEALRQESTDGVLRTTSISPGYVRTELLDHIEDEQARAQARSRMNAIGIAPDAVARAIAFAIEQPDDIEIGEITIRPTIQE